jgi:hypothetical protein
VPAALNTPAAVLRAFPSAARILLCEDRRALGTVLDTRSKRTRSPAAPSFAWHIEGRFVGQSTDRRVAAAALGARDQHGAG